MPSKFIVSSQAADIRSMWRVDAADRRQRERTGARIRAARKTKGLSQNELAQLMPGTAIDGRYVSSWERGVHLPSSRYMRALAAALEVGVGWLGALDEDEVD